MKKSISKSAMEYFRTLAKRLSGLRPGTGTLHFKDGKKTLYQRNGLLSQIGTESHLIEELLPRPYMRGKKKGKVPGPVPALYTLSRLTIKLRKKTSR